MSFCKNPKCGKEILMMVRRGSDVCSLDCDRALGTGKYAPTETKKKSKKGKKGKK